MYGKSKSASFNCRNITFDSQTSGNTSGCILVTNAETIMEKWLKELQSVGTDVVAQLVRPLPGMPASNIEVPGSRTSYSASTSQSN